MPRTWPRGGTDGVAPAAAFAGAALVTLAIAIASAKLMAQEAPTDSAETHPEDAAETAETPEAEPIVLPEIVVTATRSETPIDRLPYTSAVIGEEEIRTRLAPRSLPDALDELPGVHIQKTSPGLESPFLRGFTGFRTLLLIDGIRLNNAVLRDGPNQYWGTVDPLSIGRIEAVMGPSSVLYGSDAIGGTVNALTIEDFQEGFHPGAYYRYASAERAHTVRSDARGREGKLGYAAGVTWRDFGDIDGGRHVGEQRGTGYRALAGDVKLTYDLSERLVLTVAHQSWDQDDVPRTHSTKNSISWRGTRRGSNRKRDFDQERFLSYARARWTPPAPWLESATFTVSHHLQREREDRVRSSGKRTRQGFSDNTFGFLFGAVSPSRAGEWAWGAEYYIDTVDSFRRDFASDGTISTEFPRGAVADDSLYGQLGVFIQDTYSPAEWVEIVAGGRYNFIHASADSDNIDPDPGDSQAFSDLSESWQAAVGSGRVIFHPIEWASPFVGISQGFRAPNLSDLTRFDIAQSGIVERPNTSLDPERFVTYETGSHFRGEGWKVTASYSFTRVRDLIVRFDTGRVVDGLTEVDKDNIGDGWVQSVDLSASWRFLELDDLGSLTSFGTFSYIDSHVDQIAPDGGTEPRPISKGPPTSILVGLRWNHPERDIWIEATYRHVFEQDRLSFRDMTDTQRIPPGGTPGYGLLGIRAGWRVHEKINLFAAVENIGNRDYRVHGSGSNGPGTNFIAGVDARW